MRKIIAVALLCGFGLIPAGNVEAKNKKSSSHPQSHPTHPSHPSSHPSVHIGSSFLHVVHGRSFRFERCRVHDRDCYRYWWEGHSCYVYWYPGATCYYILTDAGLVPVTSTLPATTLPATGPMTSPTVPVDALPPLPTGVPPVDGSAPMPG